MSCGNLKDGHMFGQSVYLKAWNLQMSKNHIFLHALLALVITVKQLYLAGSCLPLRISKQCTLVILVVLLVLTFLK